MWNIKWNMPSNDVSMTHLHAICAGIKFPGALRKRWEIKWLQLVSMLLAMNLVVFVILNPTLCDCGQHSLWNGDVQKRWQTWINEIDCNRSLNQVSPFTVCEYVPTRYLVGVSVIFGIGQISYSRICNLHAWPPSVTVCWTTLDCLMWCIFHPLPVWHISIC